MCTGSLGIFLTVAIVSFLLHPFFRQKVILPREFIYLFTFHRGMKFPNSNTLSNMKISEVASKSKRIYKTIKILEISELLE